MYEFECARVRYANVLMVMRANIYLRLGATYL